MALVGTETITGPQNGAQQFLAFEDDLALYRELRIDVPATSWKSQHLSMNQRLNHFTKNEKTQYWRERARLDARGIPQVDWARVVIFYRFPDNRRREVNNLMPTSKAIVDGLVDAGVFPDDNDKHVVGPDNRREPVNGPHQVVIRVYVRRADSSIALQCA